MLERPSELIFLIGFVIYVAIRGVFEKRTKEIATVESRFDSTEGILLGLVMLGSLLIPLLFLFSPVLDFADHAQPGWLVWLAAPLMFAALWLFWRSHSDLGRNWSAKLEIRVEHCLVTAGVYRKIRHPMYSAIFLFSLAQAMLLSNWVAGFSALVTFIPLYMRRVTREEAMMLDQFGDAYKDYMDKSGRLWPK